MSKRPIPRVSVVVATRDRATRLAALLSALRAQTLPAADFELVVVDDGSRDGTAELLERERRSPEPAMRVLTGRGDGPAAARNAGWRAARAALVAFTDDDCEPPPQWLERVAACAEANPGAIIQGPTTPIPRELEHQGPFTRTRVIEAAGPWYETCNIAYPRELLERLGGFDERFPEALGEDTDLGWRARAAGAPLRFASDALMHHAVDYIGPLGKLREAARGSDSVLVFKLHPQLREETTSLGIFRNPSLARAALALLAGLVARRAPATAVLTAPYALDLARRVRACRAGPWHAGFLIAYDAVAAFSSLRGSARHRVLVL